MDFAAWLTPLAALSALLGGIGIGVVAAGAVAVRRFAAEAPPLPRQRPAVTVLKPVCGSEPRLEAALASILAQDYPAFQVVFGVQAPDDPALPVVRRLQARFPHVDTAVVIDPALHGSNRKVSNLVNMAERATQPIVVFADSDMLVEPDYLDRVVAALDAPGVGAVTCLYRGVAVPGLWSRLAVQWIDHHFLPNVLVGLALGLAKPCFGSTIALRRDTLDSIGGFPALKDRLADAISHAREFFGVK